jgi:preprotein translocase subunit YajC
MLTRRLSKPLAVGAAVVVIGGGAYGIVSATASNGSAGASTAQTATAVPAAKAGFAGKAGSNARSGPAAGGVVGTVSSVSTSSFTVSTSGGQKVTVKKASSTTYRKGTSAASASAITKGAPVLVLGTANGTTITATQVVVQPAGGGTTTFTPSKVVAFKRGAPSTAKQDGKIPANYTEGSGTIVSGTTANKATTAALAAYPGGVVDRVVKLSNGEYEVHNIGVSWPHHVFVNQSFKVVGAN